MNCPSCGAWSSVLETRKSTVGVRRRRLCEACSGKFTTYEVVVPDSPAFTGDIRLIPVRELVRLRRMLDRLMLEDGTRVVKANLDGEQLEEV